jgi:hypothetical protein
VAKQRVQTQYDHNQVSLKPMARRVDTYVRPTRNDHLSRALEEASGSIFDRVATEKRATEAADYANFQLEKARVVEDAYNNGKLPWEAVEDNYDLATHKKYGGHLMIAYNEQRGTQAGLQLQSTLMKWKSETPEVDQMNPEQFESVLGAKVRETLKTHIDGQEGDLLGYGTALNKQANSIVQQLKNQHFGAYQQKMAVLPGQTYGLGLSTEITNLRAEGKTALEIADAVNNFSSIAYKRKALDGTSINNITAQTLIDLAKQEKSLDILDMAKNVKAGSGYLWGAKRADFVSARDSIAYDLDRQETNTYHKNLRVQNLAKDDFYTQSYEHFLTEGSFDTFENPDGSEVLSQWDINQIKERVRSFEVNKPLTLEDYESYAQSFSVIPNLTMDRAIAIKNKLIESGSVNTLNELRLVDQAMKDTLNSTNAVYNSEAFKEASAEIDSKFQYDPVRKAWGLANVTEDHRMRRLQASKEFKHRTLVLRIDQDALDERLRKLKIEQGIGRPLDELTPTVKGKVLMSLANEIAGRFTTSPTSTQSTQPKPNKTVDGVSVTVTEVN